MLAKKKIFKSTFLRNVISVASGAAGAQLLTLLFMPLITRLYSTEAFGVLGVFTALVLVLTPLVSLTYPIAIILPRQDSEAKSVAKLCVVIAAIISLAVTVIILCANKQITTWFNLQSLESYLLLVPIALFFSTLQQVMLQWLIRKKQFKTIGKTAITQSLIINVLKSGLGIINPVGWVLIILATISHALYALQLWRAGNRCSEEKDRIQGFMAGRENLKDFAFNYIAFPLYRAPQQFINALSQSLPVIMLATFIGASSAGFYALAKSVMAAPVALIGKSVGDVFYPRITDAAYSGQDLYKLVKKATLLLALIAVVPFMTVSFFGPELFSVFFGKDWFVAGEYARWLALWLLFSLLNKPCVAALPVLNLQKYFLYYEVIGILISAAGLYTCLVIFKDDLLAIKCFSLIWMFLNMFLISAVLISCKSFKRVPVL
ncbi:oligosaccharide flippase family protein [Pseudoalteromonas sp. bablab_jr010]|uniref:lipopolysaccharide biosynthesis protein n=1 Tax=Pseudoalteromonas sp. bablab_jr010 TaxID=2755063 RepID=UPI0018F27FAD|nr:oligosaccharide flippase family protein [Pseudoalteromonas sp. bablab_jr010]